MQTKSKYPYYLLEGLNSFATAYFFNYVLQHLRRDHGFTDLGTLALCTLHGLLYIPGSIQGGRFGQRRGFYNSLHLGFGGQLLGVLVAGLIRQPWAQVLGLSIWTVSMCFVWPMLEALVCENESRERLTGRIGLYNFVWASTAALGVFLGGSLYQQLGAPSVYWLPAVIHGVQWVGLAVLHARRRKTVTPTMPPAGSDAPPVDPVDKACFKRLAWMGNPFNYMAVNTVIALVPALSVKLGHGVEQMGRIMSTWFVVRAIAFLILWKWDGWHYRFGWFAWGFVLLAAGFVGTAMGTALWVLLVSQVALGWASALIYYSSLYYSMDGSETQGEHGGVHEAFIGAGIFGGPAVSLLAAWGTGRSSAPALAVGSLLVAGLFWAVWIRISEIRRRRQAG